MVGTEGLEARHPANGNPHAAGASMADPRSGEAGRMRKPVAARCPDRTDDA
jgi:hypothetical protein